MQPMHSLVACALLAAAVPSQTPTLTFTGTASGDQFGALVVPFHDLDHDGAVELLVACPSWDNGAATNAGRVELRSGRTGALLRTNNGTNTNDYFGSAIAVLDDFNGDGVPEYAIGAPFADNGGADSGALKVFSGATGGLLRNHFVNETGGLCGLAVCSLRDLNGDGVRDYAYSIPHATNASAVGRVRIASGATGNVLYTMYGQQSQEMYGAALCVVGDWNNDGVDDLAIGAPDFNYNFQVGVGRVGFVSLGPTFGVSLVSITLGVAQAHLGSALARLDDINGDGQAELAVAAPDLGAGRVQVWSAPGVLLRSHNGTLAGGRFGLGLGTIGDVDFDGVNDYAIGAPFAPLGGVSLFSGATGAALAAPFTLGWANSYAGRCFAAVGDANGDGYREFAVGVPGAGAGAVHLFSLSQPARTESFGSACGVPTATGHLQLASAGVVGQPVLLAADMAPLPQGVGLLLLGWSRTQWNGAALPLPLAPFGYPGCDLLVSLDATLPAAHTVNPTLIPIGTPTQPALAGVWLHAQYALLHVGGTAFSEALSLRLGTPF